MLFNVVIGLSLLLNQASIADRDEYIQKYPMSMGYLENDSVNEDFFDNHELLKDSASSSNMSSTIVESFIFKRDYESFHFLPLETITLPVIKKETKTVSIESAAAIAVDLVSGKVLYEKNSQARLPIASLTKLSSALVVIDNVKNLNENAIISTNAIKTEGDSGKLAVGEKLSIKNLLYLMLVPSSNDAAVALAEYIGGVAGDGDNDENSGSEVKRFVDLLNNKAEKLLLNNTHYSNPAGIYSDGNYSSAEDIVKIMRYLYNDSTERSESDSAGKKIIREIIRTKQITLYSEDKTIVHSVRSTNKLLGIVPDIVGGKTGYTDEAGESLVLVISDRSKRHNIITVVLNAKDRFEQSKKLAEWVFDSYEWKD